MIKTLRLQLLICLFAILPSLNLFAVDYDNQESTKKELTQILVNDNIISFIAGDLDMYMGNKPNGVSYPLLKMTFFEEKGQIYIDIVAIDNTWDNLYTDNEQILGYFIQDTGRLFLVSSRGNITTDINSLFITTDIKRTFSGSQSSLPSKQRRNPYWKYQYKGYETAIIDSAHQESLIRKGTGSTTKGKSGSKRARK